MAWDNCRSGNNNFTSLNVVMDGEHASSIHKKHARKDTYMVCQVSSWIIIVKIVCLQLITDSSLKKNSSWESL